MAPLAKNSGRFDAILIDLDDTLFDFKWSQREAFARTLAPLGFTVDEGLLGVFNHLQADLWAGFESAKFSKDQVFVQRFARLFAHLGAKMAKDEAACRAINQLFLDHLAEAPKLLDQAEALCQHLRTRAPLVAVTNGDATVQRKRLAKTALAKGFDHLVVSDDLGVGKPDPAIFQHAVFLALGEAAKTVQPERVVMIGDNLRADIGGAKALGYTTIWLDWHKQNDLNSQVATHVVASLAGVFSLT